MHERGSKSIAAIRAEQFDEYAGLVIRYRLCNGSAKRFDPGELANVRVILLRQRAKLCKLGDLSSHAGLNI
jgi:urease beta subunit